MINETFLPPSKYKDFHAVSFWGVDSDNPASKI